MTTTSQTPNERHGLTNVVDVRLTYNRSYQRATVTMMDPATGETTVKTVDVRGHWDDPVVDASPELIARYAAQTELKRQRVADIRATVAAEAEAKAEAARIEAAKPVYGRVTGGKNAGRIGRIITRRPSMFDAGDYYTMERNGATFHASEKLVVIIGADEYEAITSGAVRYCAGCGTHIPAGQAMSGSLGTYCVDCYDAAEAAI